MGFLFEKYFSYDNRSVNDK